jgi:hypothetical protein
MEASIYQCEAMIRISTIFEFFFREIEVFSRISRLFKNIFSKIEAFSKRCEIFFPNFLVAFINSIAAEAFWSKFAPDNGQIISNLSFEIHLAPCEKSYLLFFPNQSFRKLPKIYDQCKLLPDILTMFVQILNSPSGNLIYAWKLNVFSSFEKNQI